MRYFVREFNNALIHDRADYAYKLFLRYGQDLVLGLRRTDLVAAYTDFISGSMTREAHVLKEAVEVSHRRDRTKALEEIAFSEWLCDSFRLRNIPEEMLSKTKSDIIAHIDGSPADTFRLNLLRKLDASKN